MSLENFSKLMDDCLAILPAMFKSDDNIACAFHESQFRGFVQPRNMLEFSTQNGGGLGLPSLKSLKKLVIEVLPTLPILGPGRRCLAHFADGMCTQGGGLLLVCDGESDGVIFLKNPKIY